MYLLICWNNAGFINVDVVSGLIHLIVGHIFDKYKVFENSNESGL